MNDNKRFWSRWSGIYDMFMSGNKPCYSAFDFSGILL